MKFIFSYLSTMPTHLFTLLFLLFFTLIKQGEAANYYPLNEKSVIDLCQYDSVNSVDSIPQSTFLWDGSLPYGQIVAEQKSNGQVNRSIYGLERLAEIRGDSVLWLLSDGLNNVRLVADSTGQIVGTQNFDAWGNRINQTGVSSAYGYRGEWKDSTTNLIYLRARWMDPTTGRFISEDPFAGEDESPVSLHRYLYANQSPVGMGDPSGKITQLIKGMLAHRLITLHFYETMGNSGVDHGKYVGNKEFGKYGFVDLVDENTKPVSIYEIKSGSYNKMREIAAARAQLEFYEGLIGESQRGREYAVSGYEMPWLGGGIISWKLEESGVILYKIIEGNKGTYEYQWRDLFKPNFDTRGLKNKILSPEMGVAGAYTLIMIAHSNIGRIIAMQMVQLASQVSFMVSIRAPF